MSLIVRCALAALALLATASAVAAPYPTAEELRSAIGVAAGLTQADGLTLQMEDARQAGVRLPLMAAGLNLSTGICQIYYNPAPEAGLVQFFDEVTAKELPLWLSAIAVHEATHCIEQREAYLRGHFDKVLPADLDRGGMTLKAYLGVVKSGAVETWGEALADIASVVYLQRAAPDQWRGFAEAIMNMRHRLAAKWPSHDTSAWLQKLMAVRDDTPSQVSCFEAAFRLRRLLQPHPAAPVQTVAARGAAVAVVSPAEDAPVSLTGGR
ncbi:MAG TPA: hypothetical protein VF816_09530 [Rhodocyclaceae bacterium]